MKVVPRGVRELPAKVNSAFFGAQFPKAAEREKRKVSVRACELLRAGKAKVLTKTFVFFALTLVEPDRQGAQKSSYTKVL